MGMNALPVVTNRWTDLTLAGSWVNYGAGYPNAGYLVDQAGIVWFRGLVKSGASVTIVTTLPAEVIPASGGSKYMSSACASGVCAMTFFVATSSLVAYAYSATWTSLEGVTWPVTPT